MHTRRQWISAATAFCAIATAGRAQTPGNDEVVARLTALTDDSYVNTRFNGPHFVHTGDYASAQRHAAVNSAVGQNNLGVLLILGKGTAKDEAAGFKWIARAAAQGEAEAMRNLGECYRFGLGVERDPGKAREWLLKGLSLTSRTSLAFMYATGDGGPRDLKTAAFLFATDGDSGQYLGAYEAGLHVAIGRGATQNFEMAWYYFRIADRDKRMPEATEARTLLETVMPLLSSGRPRRATKTSAGNSRAGLGAVGGPLCVPNEKIESIRPAPLATRRTPRHVDVTTLRERQNGLATG